MNQLFLSLRKPVLIGCSLMLATGSVPLSATAQQSGKLLEGTVNKEDYIKNSTGPSLSRDDIQNKGDPFGDEKEAEIFEPSDEMLKQQSGTEAPPPKFDLKAMTDGAFGGKGMPGMEQQIPTQQPEVQAANQLMMQPPQQVNPNDPDAHSPQLQLAWDQWHRAVAEEIFKRFDGLAQRAFAQSRPLACRVAYTVTNAGTITNVRMIQKSPNLVFNTMLLMVLKSMNGNAILSFPQGSRRQFVEKTGTFSRNFGVQGFKYTTGDRETVKQQQQLQQQQGGR